MLPVLRQSLPVLLLPVIMLGGIYSGAVTPTEAAAVAAAYALLLACGLYRAIGWREVVELFVGASRSTAVVALVVAGALLINYVVASEQIPGRIGAWIASLDLLAARVPPARQPALPGAGLLPRHAADAAGRGADRDAVGHGRSGSIRSISA